MYPKNLISAAIVTGSMFLTGAASAALLVTMNPAANNGIQALALSGNPTFQAVGLQSNMYSSLLISGSSGIKTFSETGHIDVTSFFDATNTTVASGVFASYGIRGNFTLSGSGSWAGSTYTASPFGLLFSVNLIGDPGNDGVGPFVNLGTATLAPGPAVAFAIAFGSVAPFSSGSALTSLTALMSFTPGPGTNGPGGFFKSPDPLLMDLSIGNAGGNVFNTGYTVDAAGKVTFTNPIPGTNPGTANVTFVQVPEPGALSLVGIALLGLGFVGSRKSKAKVAA